MRRVRHLPSPEGFNSLRFRRREAIPGMVSSRFIPFWGHTRLTRRRYDKCQAVLEPLVLSPRDDLLLQVPGQVAEVVTIPGNPDDQVAVGSRVGLRLTQYVGTDDVELDVV